MRRGVVGIKNRQTTLGASLACLPLGSEHCISNVE